MEHKRIFRGDSQSLAEESLGQLEVVGQSVFQTYVQEGKVTALHQLRGREVRYHRLVVFVLCGKRVTERQPGRSVHSVQCGRFARNQNKIFSIAQLKMSILDQIFLQTCRIPSNNPKPDNQINSGCNSMYNILNRFPWSNWRGCYLRYRRAGSLFSVRR